MNSRLWISRSARAALLVLAGVPVSLAGQGVLTGRTILRDSTRQPLSGVELVLEHPATTVATDAEGRFSVGNIPWGIQTIVVRKIGYRPVRLRLTMAANDTVDVEIPMAAAAVQLEPIEVTASTVRPGMEDFARRRLVGLGKFFDAKELRRAEGRRLSDLLAGVRGVRVVTRGLRAIVVSRRSGCPMAVWLDGVQLSGPGRRVTQDINEFPISSLEGVEVYSGIGETPAELSGQGAGSCGTVSLWTRRGA